MQRETSDGWALPGIDGSANMMLPIARNPVFTPNQTSGTRGTGQRVLRNCWPVTREEPPQILFLGESHAGGGRMATGHG